MAEIEKMTYEEAFSKLEEITGSMSEAAVPLEKLIGLYEEGMALAAHCEALLKNYEARLEKVSEQVILRESGGEEPGSEVSDDEEAPF